MPDFRTLRSGRTLRYVTPDGSPLVVSFRGGVPERWASCVVRIRLSNRRAVRQWGHTVAHFGLQCVLVDATGDCHVYRVSGPSESLSRLDRRPGVLSVEHSLPRVM